MPMRQRVPGKLREKLSGTTLLPSSPFLDREENVVSDV
jgi:hypothetical protein